MKKNIFPKVGEIEDKPLVLIIGGEKFIQPFLEKALSFYGCQVFFQSKFLLKKEELTKSDYLFFFGENWEEVQKILEFSEGKTKILFALRSFPEQNFLKDKILKTAQEKKLNVRIVFFDKVSESFVSDFIYGLLKAMFGTGTKGKIISLFDDKNGEKETEFDFKDKKSNEGEVSPKSLPPCLGFAKKRHFTLLVSLLIFIFILLLPFFSVFFCGFLGLKSLQQAQLAILSGDLVKANRKAFLAQNFLQKGDEQFKQLTGVLSFLKEEKIYQMGDLFSLGKTTAQGLASLLQSLLKTKELLGEVFQNQKADPAALLTEIKLDLDKSFSQLSLAESQFNQNQFKQKEKIEQIKELRNVLIQARSGVELLPEFLGLFKKQTYLVLFQNNSELRPTGGFIGSFGLLTFEGGRLIDFEVKDVYVADGQLKGHVEPPADLKKYLGEAGWYLRDANWDPDFPSSAEKIAWFFEKETGRTVDGVIGVNLFLAQKILQTTGEIQLPDYQEKINADNFFERAEYYSEINFFPGSTQKQDFLGSVVRVLFEKIKQGDEKIWFNLIKNLRPVLQSKDLLIWLRDEDANKILVDLGLAGELKDNRNQISKNKYLDDYLMVVEANVGINKANYFLKRSFSYQVKIEGGGEIKETLRLDYQNNSSSEAFPAGRYKSYVRIYTPPQTELLGINIKNPLNGEIKEIQSKEVEIKQEHNKNVFGFLLEVPIQESRSVEITYTLGQKFEEGVEKYELVLQKQPGIEDQAFSFWFIPPEGMVALPPQMKFSQGPEGIIFNPQFNQDLVFEINLIK